MKATASSERRRSAMKTVSLVTGRAPFFLTFRVAPASQAQMSLIRASLFEIIKIT